MEYYTPFSENASTKTHPWFNRECSHAVADKQSAYSGWPSTYAHGGRGNKAIRQCECSMPIYGQELVAHPTDSRKFRRLTKVVQSYYCQPTQPPHKYPNDLLHISIF